MEIFAKIFIVTLMIGMVAIGFYCLFDIARIKEKWRKEGKSEWQIKADFYRYFDND